MTIGFSNDLPFASKSSHLSILIPDFWECKMLLPFSSPTTMIEWWFAWRSSITCSRIFSRELSWTIIVVGVCFSKAETRSDGEPRVNDTIEFWASARSVTKNSAESSRSSKAVDSRGTSPTIWVNAAPKAVARSFSSVFVSYTEPVSNATLILDTGDIQWFSIAHGEQNHLRWNHLLVWPLALASLATEGCWISKSDRHSEHTHSTHNTCGIIPIDHRLSWHSNAACISLTA